ncbi:ABC transporter substrate-binding protein [Microvirga zambiensis]|uniref:ABC transporter substrate-binding protein n=1 Tax=Microvirga zambiensis TaxID=1402137 RepID=UPI00191E1735|nr:ABC transporter substrate-binding protein [Microvirga zambiensis]
MDCTSKMTRRTLQAAVLVLATSTTASAQEAGPGITDNSVRIGITGPLTGPVAVLSAVSEGVRARIEAVNASGGVKMGDGKTRKIELIIEDDSLDPQRTLANVRKLSERDKVFAIAATSATPNNQAIGRYTNRNGIPNVFMYSAVHELNGPEWEMGFVPAFSTEAYAFVEYLKANKPDAKVAILALNTESGKIFSEAFTKRIEGTNIKILGRQQVTSADPTVETQLANLKASGADTLVVIAGPRQGAEAVRFQAESGWKPTTLVSNIASSIPVLASVGLDNAKGIITSNFLKSVDSDQKSGIADVDQYLSDIAAAKVQFTYDNTIGQTGYTIGDALVTALEHTKAPTRQALMDAVRNMDGWESALLLEGIKLNTKVGSDVYPIEALQLFQFDGKRYLPVGGVLNFEGKTSQN